MGNNIWTKEQKDEIITRSLRQMTNECPNCTFPLRVRDDGGTMGKTERMYGILCPKCGMESHEF
jgi:hypothetical protein